MFFSDVFLPTIDIWGDLSLVIIWYYSGHPVYATLMTIPLLLNYPVTIYKWWSLETTSEKKSSWFLVVLQLWQQWLAIKVIYHILKKDGTPQEKNKTALKQLKGIEPFFESVPALLILSCIVGHAIWPLPSAIGEPYHKVYRPNSKYHLINCTDPLRPLVYTNFCAVTENVGTRWLLLNLTKAFLSGSWGVITFLQYGPCAILSTNGYLGGLLNWRFIIAFLSVATSLTCKAWFATNLINLSIAQGNAVYVWLFPSLNILPNLLLSVICILSATGFRKNFLSTLLDHPALFLLPVYTHFALGPGVLSTCTNSNATSKNKHLKVSKIITAINTGLTVISYIIVIIIILAKPENFEKRTIAENSVGHILAPSIYISVWCTFIFLSLDSLIACCPNCNNRGVAFCCTPCCFESRCDLINLEEPTMETTTSETDLEYNDRQNIH